MAEGRLEAEWSQTSAVLALLANCHRDPKKTRPFKPAQFNPFAQPRRGAAAPKVSMKSLRATLMGGEPRKPRLEKK